MEVDAVAAAVAQERQAVNDRAMACRLAGVSVPNPVRVKENINQRLPPPDRIQTRGRGDENLNGQAQRRREREEVRTCDQELPANGPPAALGDPEIIDLTRKRDREDESSDGIPRKRRATEESRACHGEDADNNGAVAGSSIFYKEDTVIDLTRKRVRRDDDLEEPLRKRRATEEMCVRNSERLVTGENLQGTSPSRVGVPGVIDLTDSSASCSKETTPATSTPIQEVSWESKKPPTLPRASCGDDYEISLLAHMACKLLPKIGLLFSLVQ